ncbi:MAG: lamin tail domain-containing protein [FCB group bacterium]|nr:lamin tail domain-containing protein [FCB group bacterium]
MKKQILMYLLVLPVFLLGTQADHLVFTKIATAPTDAEMVTIYNPTDTDVDLSEYYITDATKATSSPPDYYYNLPAGADYWSGSINDFIARFPAVTLPAGESITLGLHNQTRYFSYYGFNADLALFGDMLNAVDGVNTISLGPTFTSVEMLNNPEVLILFHWDGSSATVEDVDYFLWGGTTFGVDKTGVAGYHDDTALADQYFMPSIENDMVYVRNGFEEADEPGSGGNGITGHDETAENFDENWNVVFNPGLITPLSEIIDEEHAVGENLIVQGLIVEFADIRPSNGPQIITVQDADNFRLSLTVWDWDVALSSIGHMVDPFDPSEYVIQARGLLDFYLGWQLEIASPDDIIVYSVSHPNGDLVKDESIISANIKPAPYVIIPSMGERLDFQYSFPTDSRVIVRIFDMSGRFVTTLVDQYYADAGTIIRAESRSDWDGRDHLGQIVAPGTYFMHIEASNFHSGKTTTDVEPVVVGVRF